MVNTAAVLDDLDAAGAARCQLGRPLAEAELGNEESDEGRSKNESSLTKIALTKLPWVDGDMPKREEWKLEHIQGSPHGRAHGCFEPPERRPNTSAVLSALNSDSAGLELEPTAERPLDRDEHGNYLPRTQRARRKMKTVTICPNMLQEVSGGSRLAAFRKLRATSKSLDDFEPVRDFKEDDSDGESNLTKFVCTNLPLIGGDLPQREEWKLADASDHTPSSLRPALPGDGDDARRQKDAEPEDDLIKSLLQSVPRAVNYDEDPRVCRSEVSLRPDDDDNTACVGAWVKSCGDLPDLAEARRPQRRLRTVHVATPSIVLRAPSGERPKRSVRRPLGVSFSSDVKFDAATLTDDKASQE